MDRKIVLLSGMKYMSGGTLYRGGDTLPDTEETRALVRKKKATWEESMPGEETPQSGETDGYERQRVKDLTDLAKARGVELPGGAIKAQIIELLRAWDAENEGDS